MTGIVLVFRDPWWSRNTAFEAHSKQIGRIQKILKTDWIFS